jgi:uncharacterized protein (DUF305 family)
MKNQPIIFGIAGLVIGVLITGAVMAGMNKQDTKTSDTTIPANSEVEHEGSNSTSMSGDEMMASLEDKTGEEFDKAFITAMIEHHSSAINMAKAAQTSAGRQEIKDLAGNIIEAQQSEIDMMKQWQMDWGFAQ